MKTAAKIFLIIGIVSGALICVGDFLFLLMYGDFLALAFAIGGFSGLGYAIFFTILIVGAVIIITGSISLRRLNNATTKSELTGTAICCLIFCNVIAGILMLCIPQSDFVEYEEVKQEIIIAPSTKDNLSKLKELKELKDLKDSGIISEEEFKTLKEKYMKNL